MNQHKQNLHTHTCYCDGTDTPEAIVQEAIDRGFDSIGFSGHAYASCDEGYCMPREEMKKYRNDIVSLRDKYADKIRIYMGIEQDYFSDPINYPWDYIIGSVHYVLAPDGTFIPVDESREALEKGVIDHLDGDIFSLLLDYYKMVSRLIQVTDCDIIGHFDLVSKFNEDGTLFDANHPKYIEAWTTALDQIFAGADVGPLWFRTQRTSASLSGKPIFEINTGAISRGYRNAPYPAMEMLHAIHARGGRIMITSDSHEKSTLDAHFDLAVELAKEAGFTEKTILTDQGFQSVPL